MFPTIRKWRFLNFHTFDVTQLFPHFLPLFSGLPLVSSCYALIASLLRFPSPEREKLIDPANHHYCFWKELFMPDNFISCWPVNRLMVPGSRAHWSNQLWQGWDSFFLLGGDFECGRYWMICLLEELFNNLAIIYWLTLGRNIFSLSSFWKGKSKRNT